MQAAAQLINRLGRYQYCGTNSISYMTKQQYLPARYWSRWVLPLQYSVFLILTSTYIIHPYICMYEEC